MITAVLVNGNAVPLDEVFAELTIRHGRGDIDDGPMASTASLTLVDVDRELVQGFSCGDPLLLETVPAGPRFVGRITDATLENGLLSIVAVAQLAQLARRPIGTADYPEEPWSDRILRVFNDAGVLLTWAEVPGSFADHGGSWLDMGLEGRLVLELGSQPDPLVAFREHDKTLLVDYLGLLRDTVPAALADTPDGAVLVQRVDARSDKAVVELDPDAVLYAPAFEQADTVINSLELTFDPAGVAGVVTAEEPDSIARFELRPEAITTYLVDEGDAQERATIMVNRRAWPRWVSKPVDLLELDPAIGIGTPVYLTDLPDWAPDSAYLGIVEGWEDLITPATDPPGTMAWTTRLFMSDPRLSGGFGVLWSTTVDTWAQAAPATWNNPDSLEIAA